MYGSVDYDSLSTTTPLHIDGGAKGGEVLDSPMQSSKSQSAKWAKDPTEDERDVISESERVCLRFRTLKSNLDEEL